MTAPKELLAARYADAAREIAEMPVNDTIAGLLAHRSVRAYRPDPVPPGAVAAILAAAQSAATSSNLQAYGVVAVEDPARKARLAELANHQAHVRECPLLLVWLADLSRLDRVAERSGCAAGANRFLEMFLVAAIDAALAAQNAVVAAESLGLGTVYIGAMRNRPEEVAAELDLPPDVFAVFGLCVGYPDPTRPAAIKPRLPQALVLHRERYDQDRTAEAAAIARYDATMKAFQQSESIATAGWCAPSSARVRGPESLSGRDRLRAALNARGFGLD